MNLNNSSNFNLKVAEAPLIQRLPFDSEGQSKRERRPSRSGNVQGPEEASRISRFSGVRFIGIHIAIIGYYKYTSLGRRILMIFSFKMWRDEFVISAHPDTEHKFLDREADMELLFIVLLGIVVYIIYRNITIPTKSRDDLESFSSASTRKDLSYGTRYGLLDEDKNSTVENQNIHRNSSTPGNKEKSNATGNPGIWIQPHENATVAEFAIGGMLYCGTDLPATHGHGVDPCLINPRLTVSTSHSDYVGSSMSYWPSYSNIHPSARRTYLEWLAGGRNDPNAYIGYVFLFFYGLERRMFIDWPKLAESELEKEVEILKGEIQRLLNIYGGNGSFKSYATHLLDVFSVLEEDEKLPYGKPVSERMGGELPSQSDMVSAS